MDNLGDVLRKQIAEREKPAAENELSFEDHLRFRCERRIVRAVFENIRDQITSHIQQNKPLGSISMDYDWVDVYIRTKTYNGRVLIDQTGHPHCDLWLDFKTWLIEAGLKGTLRQTHDGGGMREWYVLDVLPA